MGLAKTGLSEFLFLVQSEYMSKSKNFIGMAFFIALFLGFLPEGFAAKTKHRVGTPSRITGSALHLQGEVFLVRGQRQRKLGAETAVRPGDWIRTGRSGRVRLDFPLFKLDLPPYTTVSIDEVAGSGTGKFSLHYGHLRVTLRDHNRAAGNLEVGLPTATMKAALGCDGEFLIHSMRTETEFRKTLAGEVFLPPSPKELPALKSSAELFGQVASIKCPADVKPAQSDQVRLRAGDMLHIHSYTASFAPIDVGLTELKSVRNTLGLPSD